MDSLAPLDVIAAHPWKRALFTTFSLGASFAEAVVVEALLRRGVEHITILSDAAGIKMALREEGAVRIGREYSLEPITVRNGCFHPKIGALWSEDRSHVLVGSGNLTFGGWSSNLECVDHIHPDGHADGLIAVADFLLDLATTPRCLHAAQNACEDFSERLRTLNASATDDGTVRLVHSLSESISAQLVNAANELGGATRLAVAAPFWSDLAVDRLARTLELEEYFAHTAEAIVLGPVGTDWPRNSQIVKPTRIQDLSEDDPDATSATARPLHAKLFEIVCKNGRLVLSGSPNATSAALEAQANSERGNIEVGILRRFPNATSQWCLLPATVPKPRAVHQEEQDDDAPFALLSAQLAAGVLSVRIFASWNDKRASAVLRRGHSSYELGDVHVLGSGFELELGEDADLLSLSGRMVLRLVCENGDVAEGFVVEPGVDAIRKRAGKALLPMLAALKQLHTPDDVLALLVFYKENPDAFRTTDPFSGRRPTTPLNQADPVITVDQLRTSRPQSSEHDSPMSGGASADQIEWQRLMQRLVAALAHARRRSESAEDDQDPSERKRRERSAATAEKLNLRFPGFFQEFAKGVDDEASFLNLSRVTNFVCVAADHPMTRQFIEQLLRLAREIALNRAGQQTAAWLALYSALASTEALAVPTARARLLSLGVQPDDELDESYALPGMAEVIAPDSDPSELLAAVRATRTVHEEAGILENAITTGIALPDLPALAGSEHWLGIEKQLKRPPERRRLWFSDDPLTACPWCNMAMLRHLKSELMRTGVTHSCCGYILVKGHNGAHD